jgi:hypothetical protein
MVSRRLLLGSDTTTWSTPRARNANQMPDADADRPGPGDQRRLARLHPALVDGVPGHDQLN